MTPSRRPRRRPATTPEGRENQLVSLAYDLAEKQLIDGTASSQVITQFLKLGTTRESLELERIRGENRLLETKAEAVESGKRVEQLYDDAIKAMRQYSGQVVEEGDVED